MSEWLSLIKTLADIIIIPLLGLTWNIQGRLSRIEGTLELALSNKRKQI